MASPGQSERESVYLKVTIIYGDNILRIGGIAHFARIKFCAYAACASGVAPCGCLLTISYCLHTCFSESEYSLAVIFHFFHSEQDGHTPLVVASQEGHSATVDVLLRCGADPNIARYVSQFF